MNIAEQVKAHVTQAMSKKYKLYVSLKDIGVYETEQFSHWSDDRAFFIDGSSLEINENHFITEAGWAN